MRRAVPVLVLHQGVLQPFTEKIGVSEMFESASDPDHGDLRKIQTTDLAIGMYVQELDRPWSDIPFLFRGFSIKDAEEINVLMNHCDYVYIRQPDETGMAPGHRSVGYPDAAARQHLLRIANAVNLENPYPDTTAVEKELVVAREIYTSSYASIENMFCALREGGTLNVDAIRYTAGNIVASVLRNPDAFFLLQKFKYNDNYCYTHAVNNCALAATFCRHLGFTREEIGEIALGALLLDIGAIRLPAYILEKPGPLSPISLKLVRHHVNFALEMVDRVQEMPQIARDMIMTHHERVSGRGYPRGLQGDQIPVCGKIAAIVDCYDAMISKRPYQETMSPTHAVHALHKWCNIDFQEDLIEQFIQCLGAYPTGTLVELNSGQIGIVLSQNRIKRFYPRVLVILKSDREHYEIPYIVDLWEYANKSSAGALKIQRSIDPDTIGINPVDYYL